MALLIFTFLGTFLGTLPGRLLWAEGSNPWGNHSVVTYPNDGSGSRPKGQVKNWGVTSEMQFSGKSDSTPTQSIHESSSSNEPESESRRIIHKIFALIHAQGDRATTLGLLGDFCTPSEKYRANGKNENQCVSRYFEVHQYWYERAREVIEQERNQQ